MKKKFRKPKPSPLIGIGGILIIVGIVIIKIIVTAVKDLNK